ncbi:hypothetical protein BGX28_001801, partial [Mortierella sp. GBA30]
SLAATSEFRQTLPVIKREGREEAVQACLKRSRLWNNILSLKLTVNMRLARCSAQERRDQVDYANRLLQVGEGRVT